MSMDNGWAFPDLDSVIDEATFDQSIAKAPVLDDRDRRLIELENVLGQKNEEIIRLTQVISQLKHEKSEDAARLIALTESIHEVIPVMKNQLVALVSEMVNKISYKVIKHELTNNSEIMPSLINAYIKELGESELIEIEVGSEDYEKLNHIQFDTKAKWRVNPSLSCGDMIVNSEISAIRVKLNEVVEKITSEHYESNSQ